MKLQKIASLILAIALVFSLGITAFAADETGSIVINGVGTEATYEVYKLLDLESYNVESKAYAYKVNAEWTAFFEQDSIKALFSPDKDGYITWAGNAEVMPNDPEIVNFAKTALAYAKEKGIAPVKSSKNAGEFVIAEGVGTFSNLELGYYLVDSTVGALCGLTTTNPRAVINAKNGQPTVNKQVEEDLNKQWGKENSADIGQIVNFRTTIKVHAGAENYVLHDHMDEGITFIKIKEIKHTSNGDEHTETINDICSVVTEDLDDGCTFEIKFTKDFCDTLKTNDSITVVYETMLNRNAVVGDEGNENQTCLSFGEGHQTQPDATKTYTYGADIIKTDSQNTLIDGAIFRLYDAAEGGNEVGVVLMDDGVTYRRAREDEMENGENVPIVVEEGKVRVIGLDNGTYYLEEIDAPDGYNKLTARHSFIISDANLDAIFTDEVYSTGSGVQIVNKSGAMLPETGGIGTTIFYVVGGLLVGGAIVALVSKKRMSNK